MSRRLSRTLAVVVSLILAVTACSDGGDDAEADASPETPSATGPSVAVPAGVTLTDPGATMDLGQPASVVYNAGGQRVSVLTVTVTKVVPGSMQKDFSNFVLGPREQGATPFYATAMVRNAGPGQLGGAKVPLFGHDSTNTVFPAAALVGDLDVCPGGGLLPERFGPKATARTCLVYLVDEGVTLDTIELRPYDGFEQIAWPVKPPPSPAPADKSEDRP